jgi:hypothetical protein
MDGHLFIHELTHVWQIEHLRQDTTYLWRGIMDKLVGQDYDYGLPDQPFRDFGMEEQASLVEEWFSGTRVHAPSEFFALGTRRPMDLNDPYFRYIAENIRLGRT